MEKLKYPIGKPNIPLQITKSQVENWIRTISAFPDTLEKLVSNLSDDQLNTPYRPEGWTIRQVVHHCYDSHHNSYTRFKWALTEDTPVIKAYDEASWCELSDSKHAPIDLSLVGIKALHAKWVYLLSSLSENDLERIFIHPDNNQKYSLKKNIGIYAWHCDHHYAHINELLKRKQWL